MFRKLITSQVWMPLLVFWLALLSLLTLQWLLPFFPNWGVLLATVLISLPIGVFQFEFGVRRRQAFLGAVLVEHSMLRKVLLGRPWLVIKSLGTSLLLSLVLIAALANIQPLYTWLVLMVWAPVWVVIFPILNGLMGDQVRRIHQTFFTMSIIGQLSVLILVTMLLLISLNISTRDLRGVTFSEALTQATIVSSSFQSVWLSHLADAWAIVDTIRFWVAQNVSFGEIDTSLTVVAWVLALIQKALVVFPVLALFQALHTGLVGLMSQASNEPTGSNEVTD